MASPKPILSQLALPNGNISDAVPEVLSSCSEISVTIKGTIASSDATTSPEWVTLLSCTQQSPPSALDCPASDPFDVETDGTEPSGDARDALTDTIKTR
ncbi:hypothetical protein FDECE_8063 [Fusarium decemcellulare]|nr:hypothetical protein FDECE_8063 [Fusarium decemcellulare]